MISRTQLVNLSCIQLGSAHEVPYIDVPGVDVQIQSGHQTELQLNSQPQQNYIFR